MSFFLTRLGKFPPYVYLTCFFFFRNISQFVRGKKAMHLKLQLIAEDYNAFNTGYTSVNINILHCIVIWHDFLILAGLNLSILCVSLIETQTKYHQGILLEEVISTQGENLECLAGYPCFRVIIKLLIVQSFLVIIRFPTKSQQNTAGNNPTFDDLPKYNWVL